jgi:hypothetical protein
VTKTYGDAPARSARSTTSHRRAAGALHRRDGPVGVRDVDAHGRRCSPCRKEIADATFVAPKGQLGVVVLTASACGVLVAVLPARRAARLDVLGA